MHISTRLEGLSEQAFCVVIVISSLPSRLADARQKSQDQMVIELNYVGVGLT